MPQTKPPNSTYIRRLSNLPNDNPDVVDCLYVHPERAVEFEIGTLVLHTNKAETKMMLSELTKDGKWKRLAELILCGDPLHTPIHTVPVHRALITLAIARVQQEPPFKEDP